jgi:hypothetical protein
MTAFLLELIILVYLVFFFEKLELAKQTVNMIGDQVIDNASRRE